MSSALVASVLMAAGGYLGALPGMGGLEAQYFLSAVGFALGLLFAAGRGQGRWGRLQRGVMVASFGLVVVVAIGLAVAGTANQQRVCLYGCQITASVWFTIAVAWAVGRGPRSMP